MAPPNITLRGIRKSIPSGYMLGRKGGGRGGVELISIADVVQQGQAQGGGGSTVGSAGTGFGTNGQVWTTVAGAAAWAFNTLITGLGTVTSGVWQGTKIALGFGGTNADLSATGPGFLKQATTGANVTVAALADADLPTQGGLTPGSYTLTSLTVNAQGFITAASSGSAGGSGTVTSVAMTVPGELSVAGSPITTAGTLAVTWANQADKTIFSRITSGSGVPSFNTLTAVLDHDLGNTNDQIASRISGTWGARNLSDLLTAGVGISLSGTTNVTITGAYTAGTGISIAGGVITNTGASGGPGGSSDFIAPIYGGGPPSIMRSFGEQTVDGGAGTGPAGSGPVGLQTIHWQTPKQKGQFVIWDGARYANSYTISTNNRYPNPPKFTPIATDGGLLLDMCAADGISTRFMIASFDGGNAGAKFPTLNFRFARGTAELPTAIQANDTLGTVMSAAGYGTTGFTPNTLRFRPVALENFTDSVGGTKLEISVAPVGSVTAGVVANFLASGCWFVGTNTNDSAAAGVIGEYIFAEGTGSDVSLTTGTIADLKSISLTAGDWDVWAIGIFVPAATTTVTQVKAWINTVSATDPSAPNGGAEYSRTFTGAGSEVGVSQAIPGLMKRVSLASTTTVYISGKAAFGTSTATMGGAIYARRVR